MDTMRIQALLQALYLLLALFHIAARALEIPLAATVTKPLLMPLLAAWLYTAAQDRRSALRWVFAALVFSTIGDVLLIGADHPQRGFSYFLGGVAAFGLAQMAYIGQFVQCTQGGIGRWFHKPVPALALLPYLAVMLVILLPRTAGPVRPAMIVYGILLVGMVLAAIHARPPRAAPWLPAGALLFLFSDSLLAFDRFHTPIPLSGVWIMTSYLAGQGLIALGSLETMGVIQNKK